MLPWYRDLVSLEMTWGNQGIHTALSCHCPYVHCLLHNTVSLSLHSWPVSNIYFSMWFSFVLFVLYSLWMRANKKNFQTPPNLWSSLLFWETGGIIQYQGQCHAVFPGKFGLRSPWCILHILNFQNFFSQSNIGGIRASWLGTYLIECVFTKLRFGGSFYTITFFMTGSGSHHFHITRLCSTGMVNRNDVALKPFLLCNGNYLSMRH